MLINSDMSFSVYLREVIVCYLVFYCSLCSLYTTEKVKVIVCISCLVSKRINDTRELSCACIAILCDSTTVVGLNNSSHGIIGVYHDSAV